MESPSSQARPPHSPPDRLPRRASIRYFFSGILPVQWAWALGLLALGLIVTVTGALIIRSNLAAISQQEFNATCTQIQLTISDRLAESSQVLRSGAALFDTTGAVSRADWRTFVQSLHLDQQLPGIQGLGYAPLVPQSQLPQLVQQIQSEGYPDFQVTPSGQRDFYAPVIYLEPFSGRNLRAFGYDVLSEPVRAAALDRARDEGGPALTSKVTLVQETGQDVQAGTLMFYPVYRHGMPVDTVDQRRAALLGWVYSPYRMTDLMNATLQGWKVLQPGGQISLQIYDGDQVSPDALLYGSPNGPGSTSASSSLPTLLVPVDFAGRHWTLRFSQLSGLRPASDQESVLGFLAAGSMISLLFCGLALSLFSARGAARRMADQLTVELRDSEEKYRALFNNEIYAICIFDLETRKVLDVNQAHMDLYGYSRAECLAGMSILDFSAEPEQSSASIAHVAQTGSNFVPQRYHRKKDGTVFPVEVVASPYMWQGRKVMFAMVHDITQRKQIETALKSNEARLSAVLDSSTDAIGVHINGIWEMCNPAAVRLFGVSSPGDLIGTSILDVIAPVERQRIRAFVQQRSAGASAPSFYETRGLRADGTEFDMDVTISTFTLEDELHTMVILRDVTERNQAVAALQESEKKYRLLFENMEEGFSLHEIIQDETGKVVDFRFLDTNKAYERHTGLSSDIIGKTMLELMPQADRRQIEAFGRVALTGEPYLVEYYSETFARYLRVMAYRTRPGRFATLFEDITLRKQAEIALRDSQIFLDSVIEHTPNPLWISDESGTLIRMNQACREFLHLRDDEMVGKYNLLQDEVLAAQGFIPLIESVFEQGATVHFVNSYEYIRAAVGSQDTGPSRKTVLDVHISPILDAGGKVAHAVVQAIDITERVRIETELQAQRDFATKIINTMGQGLTVTNGKGQFEFVNPAFAAMVGCSPEDLIGKRPEDVTLPADLADLSEQQAIRETGKTTTYESHLRREDGSITNVLVTGAPRTLGGQVAGAIAVITDLTERMQAEDRIRQLNASLEQRVRERTALLQASNEELETFAYTISHDLRSPLRAMDGFSAILMNEYSHQLDEQGLGYLARIREGSQRMGRLIEGLLTLSEITRADLSRRPVDLSQLARSIASQLVDQDPRRQVQFIIPPNLVVECDAALLKMALEHLFLNAYKFSSRRDLAVIELGVRDPSGERIFFVRDNGVGFNMAYVAKLFIPFQRLHSFDEFPGIGIGLVTVKRIINRHGGRVWAEAILNQGATFYFTLKGAE